MNKFSRRDTDDDGSPEWELSKLLAQKESVDTICAFLDQNPNLNLNKYDDKFGSVLQLSGF